MERLRLLRERALYGDNFSKEFYLHFYREYERLSEEPTDERYRDAFCYAFEKLTPSISDGELIVGKRDTPLSDADLREWNEKYRHIAEETCRRAGGGQDSHMAIDYELLLKYGISGIIKKIDEVYKNCSEDKKAFYESCKSCLMAVVKHSQSYSCSAKKQSEETTDPVRKKELLKIAEITANVPENPARSFYEAVQSVHFVTHCLSLNPLRVGDQQFQLGHIDRYLYPYYKKDIEKGIITKEFARLLLDCLAVQINMRVPNGLSSGYMLAGRDRQGNAVANELTEMGLQVIDDVRLVYPSVGFCYTADTPESLLDKACGLLLKGYSHPAIFNDDIITRGLMHYGVSPDRACDYIHSTCVEITPVASSNVWVASPYTNMPQLLLDCMDREYDCLEDLINAVMHRLDRRIKRNFEAENAQRAVRNENSQNPLLSCFVDDCLERGLDIEKGGAVYNWIMPSFVGMANLVDSLYAVRTLVFDEKRLSLCEYKKILDDDFLDNEELRLHILRYIQKYVNNIEDIDRYFGMFTDHIVKECEKYTGMHTDGKLIPSVFCWVMHEHFGRETQATPDGRKACFPLGDGSGPCQGREMKGPTSSVLSATKWDHSKLIGGVAVNMKFSKSSLGTDSLNNVKAIVRTYMKRGGFEIQINVIDNETLRKAQKNPEQYRDLVVRIGGYSDYFVRLSRNMQEEVILRTEHRA